MRILTLLASILSALLASAALGEPTATTSALIGSVRPYVSGGVYLEMQSAVLCGTTVFYIDPTFPGYKEMYSAAMTAMISGKKVILEAYTQTGCTGWGTKLQSFYVLAN